MQPPITDGALCEQASDRGGGPLLLVPALDPRLLQQLTVLLLRHPLAALFDN
jgi:hypothetical protein